MPPCTLPPLSCAPELLSVDDPRYYRGQSIRDFMGSFQLRCFEILVNGSQQYTLQVDLESASPAGRFNGSNLKRIELEEMCTRVSAYRQRKIL